MHLALATSDREKETAQPVVEKLWQQNCRGSVGATPSSTVPPLDVPARLNLARMILGSLHETEWKQKERNSKWRMRTAKSPAATVELLEVTAGARAGNGTKGEDGETVDLAARSTNNTSRISSSTSRTRNSSTITASSSTSSTAAGAWNGLEWWWPTAVETGPGYSGHGRGRTALHLLTGNVVPRGKSEHALVGHSGVAISNKNNVWTCVSGATNHMTGDATNVFNSKTLSKEQERSGSRLVMVQSKRFFSYVRTLNLNLHCDTGVGEFT